MQDTGQIQASSPQLVIRIAKGRRIGGLILSLIMMLLIGGPFAFYVSVSDSSDYTSLTEFITKSLIFLAAPLATLPSLWFAIKNMWWGDTLTLDEAGLRYKINQNHGFIFWHEIKYFRLEAPLLGMREHLGWDYGDEQANDPFTYRRLRSTGSHPTSLHGDLGPYWQGGSLAVRDILEAWRQRYATIARVVDQPKTAARVKEFPDTLVIKSTYVKYLGQFIFVAGALLAVLGVAYAMSPVHHPRQPSWWPAALLALIALATLGTVLWLLARRFLSRPQITLKKSGFELRDTRGIQFTPWFDVQFFGLIHHPQSHLRTVGWRLNARTESNRHSVGMDEDFGGGFASDPEDLLNVLEDWRVRFS